MLSVLIPVYNFDVNSLVSSIHNQCSSKKIPFEIICFEDASTLFLDNNKATEKIEHVTYSILPSNIGRSKIRNLLADTAKYNNLLFIDCDEDIPPSFIKNYSPYFNSESVICGGIVYKKKKPNEKNLLLRWKYGLKYESISVKQRNRNPYSCFNSCNFLISRYQFNKVRFTETFEGYGHEDTMFGIHLKEHNIPILHIKNEVNPLKLDAANVFIEKTRQAINNLLVNNFNTKDVRLLSFSKKLEIMNLDKIILKKYLKNEVRIMRNLLSNNPSLFYFSLFKLGYYLKKKS